MNVHIRVQFRPKDLVQQIARAKPIVDEELSRAIQILALDVHRRAVRSVPVDTGRLRSSLGMGLFGLRAEVGSNLRHAAPMEFGAKPHFPPQAPIQAWVRRVLGIRNERKAARIAFRVRKAIARRGLKRRWYLRSALEATMRAARRVVGEAAERIAARLVR